MEQGEKNSKMTEILEDLNKMLIDCWTSSMPDRILISLSGRKLYKKRVFKKAWKKKLLRRW